MSKIELVTMHRVKNYGSVLQAYATQIALEKLGHTVEVLDYYPERNTKRGMLERIKNQNKYLKRFKFLRIVARVIILPSYNKRFKVFEEYLNKYINLSDKVYHSYDEIKDELPTADFYMTGSDQVWNSEWNGGIDNTLFWNFDEINKNQRIAYSASFGKTILDDKEKTKTKELLENYAAISLREKAGADICDDLGIKNTKEVLDPTLLLTYEEWEKISSNKFENEEYILVYNLNRNKKIDNYAKNLSKKTGIKVKYISYQLHEFYKNGKMYCNPKVEDFLAIIKNAKYVISDSFHATAFSLTFRKEFVIIYPGKYSSRLQNILVKLGLENRVAKDENDLVIVDNKINYKNVTNILEEERKVSINWLKEHIR
ncbi:MAG: polysaccharide pyruvyl transferase family protein [Clostridia bacterium]|nr:polysaccharide pyruvyl transferase family protein [Clostridia bacterium]